MYLWGKKSSNIALSANDSKRIQIPDGVISYPYVKDHIIVRKTELMRHPKIKH